MSLHIDYRPDDFDEVVGNEETVSALQANLKRKDEIPHAMLFTGASGTGKTTLARIVAKKLGSKDFDFVEMDSSHFRGIDTIRELRRHMHLSPIKGSCRVWLLDECHQLSKDAQEALLKALEDTPKHVYFLLATTNPEQLKPTLKRRCTPFELHNLSVKNIVGYLQEVSEAEKKEIPEEVLKQIAIDSLGSLGKALMILDKIINLEPEKMAKAAKQVAIKKNEVIDLCRTLMKTKSWKKVSDILKNTEQEPEQIRRAVLGYCNSILLNGDNPKAYLIMDSFKDNFYNTGKAGLTIACYEIISGLNE